MKVSVTFFMYSYIEKLAMSWIVHLKPQHQSKNDDDFSYIPNFDIPRLAPFHGMTLL